MTKGRGQCNCSNKCSIMLLGCFLSLGTGEVIGVDGKIDAAKYSARDYQRLKNGVQVCLSAG